VQTKTGERDAIDKRVKEMSDKREDLFFSATIFSSIGYVLKLNYLMCIGSKFTKFDIFHIFHIFFYFFSFNNILVVLFYL
jgi:hypothetical protein